MSDPHANLNTSILKENLFRGFLESLIGISTLSLLSCPKLYNYSDIHFQVSMADSQQFSQQIIVGRYKSSSLFSRRQWPSIFTICTLFFPPLCIISWRSFHNSTQSFPTLFFKNNRIAFNLFDPSPTGHRVVCNFLSLKRCAQKSLGHSLVCVGQVCLYYKSQKWNCWVKGYMRFLILMNK